MRRPPRSRRRSPRYAAELRARGRDAPDRHRRHPQHRRDPARRRAGRRLRHPFRDVHHRPHAALPGRQGHQRPQGRVRRVRRHDLRGGHPRALRVARRQRERALPARRHRQLTGEHQPQPRDDHDQRCGERRPRRSGHRRHDRRRPVLRHRRPRGLHRRRRARAQRPFTDLPAGDGDHRGAAGLPDRRGCRRRAAS